MCSHPFVEIDLEDLFNMVMAYVSKSVSFQFPVDVFYAYPSDRQPVFSPPNVSLYLACHTSKESWSFLKFLTYVKGLSRFPSTVVPHLTGHVPTQNSGPIVECFYGWKLALVTLWWSLDNLCNSYGTFQASMLLSTLSVTLVKVRVDSSGSHFSLIFFRS